MPTSASATEHPPRRSRPPRRGFRPRTQHARMKGRPAGRPFGVFGPWAAGLRAAGRRCAGRPEGCRAGRRAGEGPRRVARFRRNLDEAREICGTPASGASGRKDGTRGSIPFPATAGAACRFLRFAGHISSVLAGHSASGMTCSGVVRTACKPCLDALQTACRWSEDSSPGRPSDAVPGTGRSVIWTHTDGPMVGPTVGPMAGPTAGNSRSSR
jgi:hypothetical protein